MDTLKWLFAVGCLALIGGAAAFAGVVGALLACILLVIGIAAVALLCIAQGRKVF